jgi:hypothetical protein
MAIPFSRSMRSLKADRFRTSLVGLSVGMLVLAAWLGWFFFARITLYETSPNATLSTSGEIAADFAPTALGRVTAGKAAIMRLNTGPGGSPQTIPAIVMEVKDESKQGRVRVELYALEPPQEVAAGQATLTGQVDVEVERISPAVLVLRASGQFLNSPKVSLSPQDLESTYRGQ